MRTPLDQRLDAIFNQPFGQLPGRTVVETSEEPDDLAPRADRRLRITQQWTAYKRYLEAILQIKRKATAAGLAMEFVALLKSAIGSEGMERLKQRKPFRFQDVLAIWSKIVDEGFKDKIAAAQEPVSITNPPNRETEEAIEWLKTAHPAGNHDNLSELINPYDKPLDKPHTMAYTTKDGDRKTLTWDPRGDVAEQFWLVVRAIEGSDLPPPDRKRLLKTLGHGVVHRKTVLKNLRPDMPRVSVSHFAVVTATASVLQDFIDSMRLSQEESGFGLN